MSAPREKIMGDKIIDNQKETVLFEGRGEGREGRGVYRNM